MVQSSKLIAYPDNKAVLLENITCTYCGCTLENDSNNTKEHVIGRRFVPKGTLDGSWNLIVRACKNCNSIKSDLENDISAITLAGKMWFDTSTSDESAIIEAERKAKNSISNKTKKSVKYSQENIKINMLFKNGVKMTFNMTAPPQVDENRIFQLAEFKLRAFFYFITYNKDAKIGHF